MTLSYVRAEEVFAVISNLALLIPFVTAVAWRRIFRAFLLFTETWVSGAYHLCDYSGVCLFSFETLAFLDFWFAQMLMIQALFYIFHFNDSWLWLEWVLILASGFGLVLLQIACDSELYVQAIIVGIFFVVIIMYWIVYYCTVGKGSLPPYDWSALTLGIALLGGSSILYSYQLIWPSGYWLFHSLWHIAAAMGMHYILMIKRPANVYVLKNTKQVIYTNAASKIKWAA